MLKRLILEHPFWSFYIIAVLFPASLMVYIGVIDMIGLGDPDMGGILGQFVQIRDSHIAAHPVLFHHQDSWLLYVYSGLSVPVALPMFFFPFAPTASALIVTPVARGKRVLLALLKLYKPLQGSLTAREGMRIYAALLALIACMALFACLREYFFGDPQRVTVFTERLGVIDWQIFLGAWFMALLFNQGAVLEELGWRGYALPLIIRKLGSPLAATLLLGVCWALWHFPREVPPLLTGAQTLLGMLESQFWFIFQCCCASIIMTYFVNMTGGSVIPAIILHGALNHMGYMFKTEFQGFQVAMNAEGPILWFVAALVILLLAGKDLGWRRRQELHADPEGNLGSDPSDAWVGSKNNL